MFRLAALNNQSNEESSAGDQNKGTKEAQEVQAFGLYNEALQLQRDKFHDEAIDVFEQLLKTSLVTDAASSLVDEHGEAIERPLTDPGLILKYSTHKNLASMSAEGGDINTAMEHYLQAVMLDTTDVTLWYRIGSLAIKLGRLPLARHAFTSGLVCNENHWPCLDAAITVLFALLNYESCLYWIAKALEKESGYTKGLVFRNKIYKDCPHLKRDTEHLFRNCSFSINSVRIRKREAKQYIDYAKELQAEYEKLCVRKPPPDVPLTPPLESLRWLELGKSLVSTYQRIMHSSDDTSVISTILFGNLDDLAVKTAEKPTFCEHLSSCDESIESSTNTLELSEDSADSLLTPEDLSAPSAMASSSSIFMTANIPVFSQDINLGEELLASSEEEEQDQDAVADVVESLLFKVISKIEEENISKIKMLETENLSGNNSLRSLNKTELTFSDCNLQTDNSDTISASAIAGSILDDIVIASTSWKIPEGKCDTDVVDEVIQYLLSEVENRITGRISSNNTQASIVCQALDISMDDDVKTKRGPKRKRQAIELTLESLTKRRSTRVRTSTHKSKQKKEPVITEDIESGLDYRKNLLELLPESMQDLPSISTTEENTETKFRNADTSSAAKPVKVAHMYPDAVSESKDVLEFLRTSSDKKDGILDLLKMFSKLFAEKSSVQWTEGIREVLVQIFVILEACVSYPDLEDMDYLSKEDVQNMFFSILNHVECEVDCLQSKNKIEGCGLTVLGKHIAFLFQAVSYRQYFDTSPKFTSATLQKNESENTGNFNPESESSIENVEKLKKPSPALPDASVGDKILDVRESREWKYFLIRVLWVRSKYSLLLGRNQSSLYDLETCQETLAIIKKNAVKNNPDFMATIKVHLPNMKNGGLLTEDAAIKQIEILKRSQVLEDVKEFFDRERYDEVVKLLKPTLRRTPASLIPASTHPHRARQIRQLLVSFEKLSDHLGLFTDAPSLLNEVLTNAKSASHNKTTGDSTVKSSNINLSKEWNSTITLAFQTFNRILGKDENLLKNLDSAVITHFTHSVCSVIHFVLTEMENNRSFPEKIGATHVTVHMWTTLYRLVKTSEYDCGIESTNHRLPQSLILLDTAHQWMGERGMCCSSNAALLRFHIKEIEERFPRMKELTNSRQLEQLNSSLDQIFFCIYGYPAKPKTRKIQEHSAKQSTLKWSDFLTLFCYFRPRHLPEFDSFKASTVSTDLSQLILRGLHLVPDALLDQIPNTEAEVISFIEADCDVTIRSLKSPDASNKELDVLADMYYLLGDFNLKNHEINKAVKYYLLDIRIHPERFDSWAGMALARTSQIDDRLRLCESKKSHHKFSDSGTERRAMAALACYKRALSIEADSVKLWIEYGSLAYWIQSMYSRKLMRKSKSIRGDELNIEAKQKQMITIAKKSFRSAQACDNDDIYEEEWFTNYMLGKLMEKEGNPPTVFLKLYQSAVVLLHKRGAKYPKKILAKYGSVSGYAIEALEMHFRIHSSILKYILKHGENISYSEIQYMEGLVEEMANSPFVLREESKSMTSYTTDAEKIVPHSKLVVVSESSDLTMGSLLPDSVLQALNIETGENQEDSPPSVASSTAPPDDCTTVTTTLSGVQCSVTTTVSPPVETTHNPLRHKADCDAIVDACERALKLCAGRFPLHNKSIYRLAHLYAHYPRKLRLQWSVDLILGSSSPWQQQEHMPGPGLLSDRNKTNVFNGVWRIPIDDIDRPGSFSFHLYRCVALLIDVTRQLRHTETLLYLHNMLNRNPDHGKRYLRDEDRIQLARRAIVYCRALLNRKLRAIPLPQLLPSPKDHTYHIPFHGPQIVTSSLNQSFVTSSDQSDPIHLHIAEQVFARPLPPDLLTSKTFSSKYLIPQLHSDTYTASMTSGKPTSADECLSAVIEAYKVYQETQKHPDSTTKVDVQTDPDDITHQRLLADAYHKYTCLVGKRSHSSSSPTAPLTPSKVGEVLEQAIRFCQQHIAHKKQLQAATQSSKSSVSSTTSGGCKSRVPEHSKGHGEVTKADSSEAAANHVKVLSLASPRKEPKSDKNQQCPVTSTSLQTNGQEGVTIVQKDGIKYTRIVPPTRPLPQSSLTHSAQSAFTSTQKEGEKDSKRPKMDPKLGHLADMKGEGLRNKLVRSTSVPVTNAGMLHVFPEDSSDSENKPPMHHRHRLIARTSSSVSDYTKNKLKLSILAKTSAALVRKPSITDQEMMQIHDDPDAEESSSGSEDEDDAGASTSWRGKRKYSDEAPPALSTVNQAVQCITSQLSPIHTAVITTAGST